MGDPIIRAATDAEQLAALRKRESLGDLGQIRAELAENRADIDLVQDLLVALIERRECSGPYHLLNEQGRAEQEVISQKVRALRSKTGARGQ